MTASMAARLTAGDRVVHADGTEGTVADHGYAGITVRWDDDICSSLPLSQFGAISRAEGRTP